MDEQTTVPSQETAPEANPPEGDVVVPAAAMPGSKPSVRQAKGDKKEGEAAPTNKLQVIIRALKSCEQNIANIVKALEQDMGAADLEKAAEGALAMDMSFNKELELAGVRPSEGRVVEGVFDGQNMVGSDGKIYSVPPNYASKSRLVEGDMLKLTITPAGSFIYKQIGPSDRTRIVATLGFDPTVGEYYITDEDRRWNVLKASVTYYKGEPDDEAVALVPKNGPSKWAAIENIVKRNQKL